MLNLAVNPSFYSIQISDSVS